MTLVMIYIPYRGMENIMKSVLFNVSGMNCGGCVAKVERELATFTDINKVEVDLENQEIKVSGEDTFSNMKVKQTLTEIGFPVSGMKKLKLQ